MIFNSCNGRCQLQKSLKKYADSEKKMQDFLKEKPELLYIQQSTAFILEFLSVNQPGRSLFGTPADKPVSVSISTFRPPSDFS
jgi:hypothetical protein